MIHLATCMHSHGSVGRSRVPSVWVQYLFMLARIQRRFTGKKKEIEAFCSGAELEDDQWWLGS